MSQLPGQEATAEVMGSSSASVDSAASSTLDSSPSSLAVSGSTSSLVSGSSLHYSSSLPGQVSSLACPSSTQPGTSSSLLVPPSSSGISLAPPRQYPIPLLHTSQPKSGSLAGCAKPITVALSSKPGITLASPFKQPCTLVPPAPPSRPVGRSSPLTVSSVLAAARPALPFTVTWASSGAAPLPPPPSPPPSPPSRGFTEEEVFRQRKVSKKYTEMIEGLEDRALPSPLLEDPDSMDWAPLSGASSPSPPPSPTLKVLEPPSTPQAGPPVSTSSPPPVTKKRRRPPVPTATRVHNLRMRRVTAEDLVRCELEHMVAEVATAVLADEVYRQLEEEVMEEMRREVLDEAKREVELELEGREVLGEVDLEREVEEGSSWTQDKPYGNTARTCFYQQKIDLKAILTTFNVREQMELTMFLAAANSQPGLVCPMKKSKMRVTVSPEKLSNFLSSQVSLMSKFRRNKALARIFLVLTAKASREPELVLEAALLDSVLLDPRTLEYLQSYGLELDATLKSSKMGDRETALNIMEKMVVGGRNTRAIRVLSVDHGVAVVQQLGLSIDTYGDTSRLKEAIRCDIKYAKRLLTAIKDNKVEEMKTKKTKKTAITESDWPRRVAAALQLPTNVRFNPGAGSVSLSYGKRASKIFMEKSKLVFVREVLAEYKALNPEEESPCMSSMLCLIPANYRQKKEADRENNVCPRHSNMDHLVGKLRPIVPSLPTSSKELSGLVMCPPSATNVFSLAKPLTWNRACSLRTCTSCPAWRHPDLPEEVLDSQLAIPQWGNVYDARKKKDVHALHTKMFTVREALELLNKQMQQMPTHLYKMFTAYEALERAIAGLKPGQLITLEDYQQNIVARPWATDTSAHMTHNVRQEMLYPIVGFTKLVAGGPTVMVGWIFVSDDLKHDFHQVNAIEIQMMQSYRELFGLGVVAWTRFSDNCAAQFKSQYALQKMLDCLDPLGLPGPVVNWVYFEPNHGKSLSDMLGSQAKRALERGVARDKDWTGRDAEAVGLTIAKNINEETKKFKKIKVLIVPEMERPEGAKQAGAVVPGINKMRHFTMTGPGKLLGREVHCFDCLDDLTSVCKLCSALPSSYPATKAPRKRTATVAAALIEEEDMEQDVEEDVHRDERIADPFNLLTERDMADAEEEDAEMVEARKDEEPAEVGDFRWVKERKGSWWPCQVVPASLVPATVVRKFGAISDPSITWVKLIGRGDEAFKPLPPWDHLPFLGTTIFDLECRGLEEDRVRAYDEACMAKQGFV